jgi:hypothetical protein
VDGSKRENGAEVALPDRARIGLAGVVFLDFEAVYARQEGGQSDTDLARWSLSGSSSEAEPR